MSFYRLWETITVAGREGKVTTIVTEGNNKLLITKLIPHLLHCNNFAKTSVNP